MATLEQRTRSGQSICLGFVRRLSTPSSEPDRFVGFGACGSTTHPTVFERAEASNVAARAALGRARGKRSSSEAASTRLPCLVARHPRGHAKKGTSHAR